MYCAMCTFIKVCRFLSQSLVAGKIAHPSTARAYRNFVMLLVSKGIVVDRRRPTTSAVSGVPFLGCETDSAKVHVLVSSNVLTVIHMRSCHSH